LALLDLPATVRRQVEAGTLPKSSAYEISKLADDRVQIGQAVAGDLSDAKAVNQINQRRGRKASKSRQGLHQVFYAESGFTVTVSARTKANYHEVEQALLDAVDEVRHRIKNGATLF
jgi:ParB family chromosome partitioning protein